jgi:asparagine synthase (glutamine-hydrolysing)
MLAGFLHRGGIRTVAITRGQAGDLEMECARRVADALGFEHRSCPEASGDPVGGTLRRARWEHLANGAFTATDSSSISQAGPLPQRIMSGYSVDLLMPEMKLPRLPGDPWDAYFKLWFSRVNPWGFPGDVVSELLGDHDPVRLVMDDLGEQFRAAGSTPARALVAMALRYTGRFRVGSIPWRLSFESWPSLPILDREFVDLVAAMPMAAAGERHVEKELLCRKFPALAALPLDRNSYDSTPLRPRLRYLVTHWARARLGLVRGQDEPRTRERRYYYRVSDFDGPEWQAVRTAAGPLRAKAAGVLRPDVLARLLAPPSGIHQDAAAKLKGATGTKLLLVFLLWASEHS